MSVQVLREVLSQKDTKIRDALLGDVTAMAALLRELFSIEADFAVDEARQRRGLIMMLEGSRSRRCIKVAEADNTVVGMCSAQTLISTAEGGKVAVIEDMVVDKAYRGQGIGRLLMSGMEDWARRYGIRRLQLLADRTNFSALDLYDRMGWIPTRLICLRRKWKQQ